MNWDIETNQKVTWFSPFSHFSIFDKMFIFLSRSSLWKISKFHPWFCLIAMQFNILSFFNLTILLYYLISFLFTIKNHSHVYLHVTCVRRMLTSCTCASNTFNVMRLVRLNVNQRQVCRKKDWKMKRGRRQKRLGFQRVIFKWRIECVKGIVQCKIKTNMGEGT